MHPAVPDSAILEAIYQKTRPGKALLQKRYAEKFDIVRPWSLEKQNREEKARQDSERTYQRKQQNKSEIVPALPVAVKDAGK